MSAPHPETPVFLFDEARQGLSFTQEVQLLASLQLELGDGPLMREEDRPRLDIASGTTAERAALKRELLHDLIDRPIRVHPHREWLADAADRWPACLREAVPAAGLPGEENPWTFAVRPIVTGRLRRLRRPEIGFLALMGTEDLERHMRILGEAGLNLAMQALNPRERLVALATLELRAVPALCPALEPVLASMEARFGQPLRTALQALLNQCSSRAREPSRMLDHFFAHLFAAGFGVHHRHEARAVALRLKRRDGAGLLRACESTSPRQESVALTVRSMSMALLETLELTRRVDGSAADQLEEEYPDEPGRREGPVMARHHRPMSRKEAP